MLEVGEGEHELIRKFEVTGIPFCIIIDKNRRVRYTGSALATDTSKTLK